MSAPIHITFRHIEPSAALDRDIRERAADLFHFCDDITGCRVVVDAPAPRHHHGKIYQVRIVITVPGTEIVVSHAPAFHHPQTQSASGQVEKHMEPQPDHKDAYIAVADAFGAIRRQLDDYVRVRRGEVKGRAAVSAAGVMD
jgi:ribosome-associated translation inhibitor RaiA